MYYKNITVVLATLSIALFNHAVRAEVTFPDSVYTDLDYGLYWFDYSDAEKAEPGQLNPYYDPNKNTILYIHGWQTGSTSETYRETLNRSSNGGPDEDLSQYWLDRGWNVGILYWNQFADESEVKDAEAKIYATDGPQDMRWMSLSGSYQSGPSQNVTELLLDSIVDNMSDFSGAEFRLTGHSLGNQLALTISYELMLANQAGEVDEDLVPDRIALLDPFYSLNGKDYLDGQWVGEVARDYAGELISEGVAIEAYRSSAVTSTIFVGDANTELMDQVAFSELKPWYFSFWQVAEKHQAAVTWYFWSVDFDTLNTKRDSTDAPSAASSNSQISTLMNKSWSVYQTEGRYTETPADDEFSRASR